MTRDTPLNKDFYTNLKAQGWWQLRRRFEKTQINVPSCSRAGGVNRSSCTAAASASRTAEAARSNNVIATLAVRVIMKTRGINKG